MFKRTVENPARTDTAAPGQLSEFAVPKARLHVRRSRGSVTGVLLIALGAWGALTPFIGPSFSFGYGPGGSWSWSSARGWYEVLPGSVAVIAGLILLLSANRLFVLTAALMGAAAGAWFVVGPQVTGVISAGSLGAPTAATTRGRTLESLADFYALGAVMLFLAAAAFGRLSVRSLADLHAARDRAAAAEAPVASAPVAPAHEAPAYEPPAPVAPAPVVSQPVVSRPVTGQPVVNQPVVNQPVTGQPVVNQPVVNQPVTDQPAVDRPMTTR